MSEIRFLKHAVKFDGKRVRVWYSNSKLSNYPEGTVTIYARDYDHLPAELKPVNHTDSMSDYFDKDAARITPDSPYYATVVKFVRVI